MVCDGMSSSFVSLTLNANNRVVLFRLNNRLKPKCVFCQNCLPSLLQRHSLSRSTWGHTCNLPRTSILLRHRPSNDPVTQNEPSFCELYYKSKAMEKDGDKKQGKSAVVIHDGPPYANGNLHLGHAVNKITKDFIARYYVKRDKDYSVDFKPGWDCHGMPIEHKLLKKIQSSDSLTDVEKQKKMKDPVFIRNESRKLAEQSIRIQKDGFRQWGVCADWDQPYLTFDTSYVMEELRMVYKLFEAGLLYRAKRPVYYSPSSGSVLADSEIEYHTRPSTAVYLSIPLIEYPHKWAHHLSRNNISQVHMVVWTTQPWTLLANAAIAFNPDLKYVMAVDGENNRAFVMEKSSMSVLQSKMQRNDFRVIHEIDNEPDFRECFYKLAFDQRDETRRIVAADFVVEGTGTGLVHMAPCHGNEDFHLAQKELIPFDSFVNEKGVFECAHISEVDGKPVLGSGNKACVDLIDKMGFLLHKEEIQHSYPCDWRTKEPVITLLSQQWFIDVSKIVPEAIQCLDQVQFYPASSKNTFTKLLSQRTSWCISRQRHWGVPLPVFYDNMGKVYFDKAILDHVLSIFEKKGVDCWWILDAEQLLPEQYKHLNLSKGADILDVWLDSGSSWHIIPNSENENEDRQVFYVEGCDQFRGWFQSSLLTCFALKNKAPFTHLYSHGFVLDHTQEKMSKSLGNVVDPQFVIQKYGVDTLRLWVALANVTDDITYSEKIVDQTAKSYQKLRSVLRILCANLYDFDSNLLSSLLVSNDDEDSSSLRFMKPIDQFIVLKCNEIASKCDNDMEALSFHLSIHRILKFVHEDVSAFYLNSIKDRLYCSRHNSLERRSAQFALFYLLKSLHACLDHFTPFLCSELTHNFKLLTSDDSFDTTSFLTSLNSSTDSLVLAFGRLREVQKSLLSALGNDARLLEKCDVVIHISPSSNLDRLFNMCSLSNPCLREAIGCRAVDLTIHSECEDFVSAATQLVALPDSLEGQLKIEYDVDDKSKRCPRCRLFACDDHSAKRLCSRCQSVIDE